MNYMTQSSRFADIAVIGGGAAGMMAACTAARAGADVVIFEKKDRVGRKLRITGKGRCNVTNDCDRAEFMQNVASNPKFLYTALSRMAPSDTKDFSRRSACPLRPRGEKEFFPCRTRRRT